MINLPKTDTAAAAAPPAAAAADDRRKPQMHQRRPPIQQQHNYPNTERHEIPVPRRHAAAGNQQRWRMSIVRASLGTAEKPDATMARGGRNAAYPEPGGEDCSWVVADFARAMWGATSRGEESVLGVMEAQRERQARRRRQGKKQKQSNGQSNGWQDTCRAQVEGFN